MVSPEVVINSISNTKSAKIPNLAPVPWVPVLITPAMVIFEIEPKLRIEFIIIGGTHKLSQALHRKRQLLCLQICIEFSQSDAGLHCHGMCFPVYIQNVIKISQTYHIIISTANIGRRMTATDDSDPFVLTFGQKYYLKFKIKWIINFWLKLKPKSILLSIRRYLWERSKALVHTNRFPTNSWTPFSWRL